MTDDVLPQLRNFLVQRYDHLKRTLIRKLGNDDLADDALQETWLRLQRNELPSAVANPQAYVTRMAVNVAIDIHRSRSQVLSSGEVEELWSLAPDPAPGPARIVEDRSQVRALEEILSRMPPRRREILMMVRWEGLTHKEVAKRFGIAPRAVEYEVKAALDFCTAQMAKRTQR